MIKAEIYKVLKKRSSVIMLIIYSMIVLGNLLFYTVGEGYFGITLYSEGQFIQANLALMMAALLPFITLYFISSSLAYEFSSGTIKNMQLLPIKKEKVYFSKLISVQGIIGVILTVQFIITFIVSLIQDGGMGIDVVFRGIMAYVGAFIVLGLINLLGGILTLWLKSTGLTIIITYVIYMGISFLEIFIPRFEVISITRIISDYQLILKVKTVNQLLIIGAYYIIFMVLGTIYFDKREESLCQYE